MEQFVTNPGRALEVISPDTGLTAQQEKCAALLASGIRITDLAESQGISRGTLYRWLNQAAFQCYYNLMKQDIKDSLEGEVLGLHTKALEGIKSSLDSDNEAQKLKASMWVLDKISQMPVGATDIRKVLKESSAQGVTEEVWDIRARSEREKEAYLLALQEAGLEE